MKIDLIHDLYIEIDGLNYTLKEKTVGKVIESGNIKKGGIYKGDVTIGYYANIGHAVNKAVEVLAKKGHETLSLEQFLEKYTKLVDEFKTFLQDKGLGKLK